ncbi:hypothetical protein [Actinomadura parmotrematis]|uniref:Secreted protein/lipoprotein n=1 Tax=Actinomadura parmotrematis TaxID=2864039 RepID=A0ABS7FN71_9ACTN|nr:hypothetical protein [Actinomadura parmotrematis]MBW8481440.1 hypothetical protein [Actinomadura parmotrematis]
MAMRVRPVRPRTDGGRTSPRTALLCTVLVLAPAALTAAACGSQHPSGGAFSPSGTVNQDASAAPAPSPDSAMTNAPTRTTAAVPPTAPVAQVNKAVLDAYRAYQSMYQKVYERNDPTGLDAVAMDPLLTKVTKDVQRTKTKGEIWRFTNVSNPRVYARNKTGDSVFISDCLRTLASYRYSAKTGKRTGGGPGTSFAYRAAVRYTAGVWKVSDAIRDKKC